MTTSTVSPFLRPMIALPTGDSFESFRSAGFASAEPTMKYSAVSFASTSRRRTTAPTETTLVSTRFLSMTWAFEQALLELRDAVLEHHLLVLRVVVLGVLGDLAELTGSARCAPRLSRRLVVRSPSSSLASAACSPRE